MPVTPAQFDVCAFSLAPTCPMGKNKKGKGKVEAEPTKDPPEVAEAATTQWEDWSQQEGNYAEYEPQADVWDDPVVQTQDEGGWNQPQAPPGSWDAHDKDAWGEISTAKPTPAAAPTVLPTIVGASPMISSGRDLSAALAAAHFEANGGVPKTHRGTMLSTNKGPFHSRATSMAGQSAYTAGAPGTMSSWSVISGLPQNNAAPAPNRSIFHTRGAGAPALSTIPSESLNVRSPQYVPLHAKSTWLPSATPTPMKTGPLPPGAVEMMKTGKFPGDILGFGSRQSGVPAMQEQPRFSGLGVFEHQRPMSHGERVVNGQDMEYSDERQTEVEFRQSNGEALRPAYHALFGDHRPADQRLIWILPPHHNPIVTFVLNWIESMAFELAFFAIHKLFETREKGALITNAGYGITEVDGEPYWDYITFTQARGTLDRYFQEPIATYDPYRHCIVYVMLVSKTGNSVGMWRKKLPIPDELLETYAVELDNIMAELSARPHKVAVERLPSSIGRPKLAPGGMMMGSGMQPTSILRNGSVLNPTKPVPFSPVNMGVAHSYATQAPPAPPAKVMTTNSIITKETSHNHNKLTSTTEISRSKSVLKKNEGPPGKKKKRGWLSKLLGVKD